MTKEEQWLLEEKYSGVAGPAFEADRARLQEGEPVAYVIGWQPFLGLKIYLDSKPLIPRTETEYWVEQLIAKIGPDGPAESKTGVRLGLAARSAPVFGSAGKSRFLDLCSGSGAIGRAILKQFPTAHVSFGEIAPAHEVTIRKNIRENSLDESRADIRIGDLFEPFKGETFDVILANPPYIPEARALPASVAEYEPSTALFSGTDGLELMRRIAGELPQYLNKGGQAWIECDSLHAEEAAALFRAEGFLTEVHNDQFGLPRVIVISWA